MVGIAQEQHGDRTRLFMQWKRMNWPVLIDPLNLLEVKAVPITLLIDESGIVRGVNPNLDQVEEFVNASYDETRPGTPVVFELPLRSAVDGMHHSPFRGLDAAIAEYGELKEKKPRRWFELGVLYRARHDSAGRQRHDFDRAIQCWGEALTGDPSQYIWRRRIQQYGPRLDKPYSFYDWVTEAREEITMRGEKPIALSVEPSGAEFAKPSKKGGASEASEDRSHPDPEGRLPVDEGDLILVNTVAVPSTDRRSPAWRVHVEIEPNRSKDVHWNNESGVMEVWLDSAGGWNPPPALRGAVVNVSADAKAKSESAESRTIEFELRPGEGELPERLSAVLFAYVCEGRNGTCLFVKRSFSISLER